MDHSGPWALAAQARLNHYVDCALPGQAEAVGRVIWFNDSSKTFFVDIGLVLLVVIVHARSHGAHSPSRKARAAIRRARALGPARTPGL